MAYALAQTDRFSNDLSRMPRKVRRAYEHLVGNLLLQAPDRANPPQIKRLGSYQDLWRLRIADTYRLVYRVDTRQRSVCLLMIDHRDKIYERLGADDNGEPGLRIIAGAEGLINRELTAEEKARAYEIARAMESPTDTDQADRPLPAVLDPFTLSSWGIPRQHHSALGGVTTENELLDLEGIVPGGIIVKVLDCLWPPVIEEVVQKPVRRVFDPIHVVEAAEGRRSLASFLLLLDEEQEEFLARFRGNKQPQGPWLLKGGPGSGKSTVALYCIRELMGSLKQLDLFNENRPLQILYTTFTNSLTRSAEHLLNNMDLGPSLNEIEVRTVDSLAAACLPAEWRGLQPVSKVEEYIRQTVAECIRTNPRFSFTEEDVDFLAEELDWVLIGQGIDSLEEYQGLDRTGRGRALGQHQRRHLWELYGTLVQVLRQEGVCLFSQRLKAAAETVSPRYDYVFVDEAQDLKAVAVRFLRGLCYGPNNIFLTADINQSIWGSGFSWTKMASDFNMQGRTRILRRNYRTTQEIWQGVLQLAPKAEGRDEETLNIEAVYRGARPVLARYTTNSQLGDRLNSYLGEALRKEKATLSSAAVLCPTSREINAVMQVLDKRFKAKAMRSKEVDFNHPGVKVMTMHAAKGLEFPVAAVVGLEKGRMPRPARLGTDKEEHLEREKRLLFVACSRAMRRLMVFAHRDRPSPFAQDLTEEYWDIEELDR